MWIFNSLQKSNEQSTQNTRDLNAKLCSDSDPLISSP